MNAHKMMVWSMILVMLLSAAGSFASARGENEKVQTRGVILIHNVYDLQNMSKDLNASYELANDINATITKTWNGGAGFIPIGNKSAPFNGTFDGQGYKIVGLYINSSASYTGLFGYTTKNANISNVGLIDVNVTASSSSSMAGGLVGINKGVINNSYATGNVSASGEYSNAGGLAGVNHGTVSDSYAFGNVSGGDDSEVGGLLGENYGMVNDSYATGNVSASGEESNAGGLVGWNEGKVNNSYATGNVCASGEYSDAGGLVGANYGTVNNSYAIGNVTVSGYLSEAGGLVGVNNGNVRNSHYNVDTATISGKHYVTLGGLFNNEFNDWLSHGMHLNIDNYSSLVPDGEYYDISSVQGLKDLLGFEDEELKFRLTANIDLSSLPNFCIPTFGGVFDGRNHTISNLSYNASFAQYGGLFGWNGGTIENLRVTNVSVSSNFAGGLVGYNNNGTVSNSYAIGNVSGEWDAGGLAGYNGGTVSNSYATGNVIGGGMYLEAGGLVGVNYGTVNNTYATDNVSTSGEYSDAGGLVGYNGGTMSNSYATGSIYSDGFYSKIGGLVGHNGGTMSNSYATGKVSGSYYVGGLVGYNGGTISNSYATGKVSASGDNSKVGGLVGENDRTVNNTYATGNVYSIGDYSEIGGLVGDNRGKVSNSYATGNVGGNGEYPELGGLVAQNDGTVTASFWDVNTSGINTSAGGLGKSTAQMMNESTFLNAGWDFNTTWGIWNGKTYPFLRWQGMQSIASAPRNLSAKTGNGFINLTWDAPANDGGLTVTEYKIYCNGSYLTTVPATQLWYNDTDLVNGVNYTYYVTAVNEAGESPKSNKVTAAPGVPMAPENLTSKVGNKYVNLTWNAPMSNGGFTITEYKIYRNGALLATVPATVPATQLWYNDTNVSAGVTYTYYVTAVNAVGESPKSNEVQATPPASVPEMNMWLVWLLAIALLFLRRRK